MNDIIALPVLLDILSRGSAVAVTTLIIWALATDRVVTRGRLRDAEEEREREHAECEAEKARLIADAAEARRRADARFQAVLADRDRLRERLEGRHRRWSP